MTKFTTCTSLPSSPRVKTSPPPLPSPSSKNLFLLHTSSPTLDQVGVRITLWMTKVSSGVTPEGMVSAIGVEDLVILLDSASSTCLTKSSIGCYTNPNLVMLLLRLSLRLLTWSMATAPLPLLMVPFLSNLSIFILFSSCPASFSILLLFIYIVQQCRVLFIRWEF